MQQDPAAHPAVCGQEESEEKESGVSGGETAVGLSGGAWWHHHGEVFDQHIDHSEEGTSLVQADLGEHYRMKKKP